MNFFRTIFEECHKNEVGVGNDKASILDSNGYNLGLNSNGHF